MTARLWLFKSELSFTELGGLEKTWVASAVSPDTAFLVLFLSLHLPLVSSFVITYIAPFFLIYSLLSLYVPTMISVIFSGILQLDSFYFSFPRLFFIIYLPWPSLFFYFLSYSVFPLYPPAIFQHFILKCSNIQGWKNLTDTCIFTTQIPLLTFYKTCFITYLFISLSFQQSVYIFFMISR